MSCSNIAKNIASTCSTAPEASGLEVKMWVYNRTDHTFTFDNSNPSKITGIANASTKKAYTATGIKKSNDAGHDRVVKDKAPDRFTHHIMFEQFEMLAEDIENVDNMKDVVVVVEAKSKTTTGQGVFLAYGVKNGLYPTSDTRRMNTNNGIRSLELASMADNEEPYSHFTVFSTNYAQTLAMLVATETPGS